MIDLLAPSLPFQISLPYATNLLHVSIEAFHTESGPVSRQILYATTSDRRLTFIDVDQKFTIIKSPNHIHDSPILSCLLLSVKSDLITVSSGMSGQVIVYDHEADKVVDERRDHKKYAVKVATCLQSGCLWIATAGWDAKVYIYRLGDPKSGLGPPVAVINLPTNPETIVFVEHPHARKQILLVTRRDSTSLYYYRMPESPNDSDQPTALELLGSQNLAPHSNAWMAFSPSSVAICPTDPTMLAVATSAVPHMKLIIVRLLLPPLNVPASGGQLEPATQATQTRASLALQDQEDAAIQVHVNTLAPQTPYSTPQLSWRPDGTGIWVNGDDGVLRGLAATTGKVETLLKDGHEVGSKIRSIWCGIVDVHGTKEEWLVSGGFDRRLVVWKPQKEGS